VKGVLLGAGLTAAAALAMLVLLSQSAAAAPPGLQYFALDAGAPNEAIEPWGAQFAVPVFVLGEPAGSPATEEETLQAWETLSVTYLGPSPAPDNWSVSSWGTGEFTLVLNLTSSEITAVDDAQALIALNSSVEDASSVYGASGTIGSGTLSSAILASGWWSEWFGINTPPPDPSISSLGGIVADLAWWGNSTAGRASYAATTIVAVTLYLWEGHKLARKTVLEHKPKPTGAG
jgi:hypothetical protein